MSEIIGADAAKLAGLQVDMLQKVRSGQITLAQIEWFNNRTKEERDALVKGWKAVFVAPTEKFTLLIDLGTITVSNDFVHDRALERFFANNAENLYNYNKDITDENFPHPSRILKPGDRLRVRAYRQIVGDTTTSQERMAYLNRDQRNVYVGAQGTSLVFEQKRDQLPKGKWYASFDEEKNLWMSSSVGLHGVSLMDACGNGGFSFDLGYFEGGWGKDGAFFGFSDVKPSGA